MLACLTACIPAWLLGCILSATSCFPDNTQCPHFVLCLQTGVAVRSGHLCTQPVHRHLGISSSVRASPYIYNTALEVDAFVDALTDSIKFFT
jgi:hypothetical protein